ncbi:unnamed protein product, partial [Brassica rapa subsp. trilocularis]
ISKSRHAHHHHFLCVSFDDIVAVVMVSSSPPWSLVSSSHRLAPSSPSRARSVVTVSNSLRRHCIELAPSSMYRARSVVNGLKLALSPPLSNSPQKSSMEKEIERIQRKIVRR